MAVVTARVHHPGRLRAERKPRLLDDRQRVDIRAERDPRCIGVLPWKFGDDPGARDCLMRHAKPVEILDNPTMRALFLSRQLRVPVEVPPQLDDSLEQALVNKWCVHCDVGNRFRDAFEAFGIKSNPPANAKSIHPPAWNLFRKRSPRRNICGVFGRCLGEGFKL